MFGVCIGGGVGGIWECFPCSLFFWVWMVLGEVHGHKEFRISEVSGMCRV